MEGFFDYYGPLAEDDGVSYPDPVTQPKSKPDPAAIVDVTEALQNFMGLFDSPIGRRLHGKDDFFNDAIKAGRAALEKAGVS